MADSPDEPHAKAEQLQQENKQRRVVQPKQDRRSRSRSPLGGSNGDAESKNGDGHTTGEENGRPRCYATDARKSSRSSRDRPRKLFVSNIPYECDWRKLKDLIKDEVGEECYVEIAMDSHNNPLGFGLLEFRNFESGEKCIDRLNQAEVNGRKMIVRELTLRDEDKIAAATAERLSGLKSAGARRPRSPSVDRTRRVAATTNDYRTTGDLRDRRSVSRDRNDRYADDNIPPAALAVMRRNGIEPPLYKSVFVANVPFDCDESKLRDIFHLAGKVISVDLKLDDRSGNHRGFGTVEFETELEALQAICMLNEATLYDRVIKVRFDAHAVPTNRHPRGLDNIGPGFGPGGIALKNVGLLEALPDLLRMIPASVFSQLFAQAGLVNNNFGISGRDSFSSKGGNRAVGNETSSIIVSNLPSQIHWRAVKERFSDVGEIQKVDVRTRSAKQAVAVITYATSEDARKAVRLLHEGRFEGRNVVVRMDD